MVIERLKSFRDKVFALKYMYDLRKSNLDVRLEFINFCFLYNFNKFDFFGFI